MSLKEQLKADMKEAMKAREAGKVALSVIRMVNGAIKIQKLTKSVSLAIQIYWEFWPKK